MEKTKGILVGATIGTIIGSLTLALYPKRKGFLQSFQGKTGSFAKKAREAAALLLEDQELRTSRKNEKAGHFLAGSFLGAVAGASTALLLAPKSGRVLRNQLVRAYEEMSDKTQELIRKNGLHVPAKKRKQIAKAVKRIKAKSSRR